MTMACYVRSMIARIWDRAKLRVAVLLVVVGLAAAACGSSSTVPDSAVPDTAGRGDGARTAVFLGDGEAGFGPGSLAATAGEVARRLSAVDGDWRSLQPFTYTPRPEVCGIDEPLAAQGSVLSLVDPTEVVFFDFIGAEVLAYETEAQTVAVVEAANGPNAAECDRALLAERFEDQGVDIGVDIDLGDGVGVPVRSPTAIPEGVVAETRHYVGTLGTGSITRDLVQIESTVALGRFAIRFFALTASDRTASGENDDGGSAELLNLVAEAILSEPLPELVADPLLDRAIDVARQARLVDGDIPEFWDSVLPILTFREDRDPDSCYQSPAADARLGGPTWNVVNPGAGVSQLQQETRVFPTNAAATNAFAEFIDLGVDCLIDSLALPLEFRVNGRAFDTVEIDGIEVGVVRLDVAQTVGTQIVDVEFGFAMALEGRYTTSVFFGGLIGDSPDLAALVTVAAKRLETVAADARVQESE